MIALAVSKEPAPFPIRVTSPARSVLAVTALRVSLTTRMWFFGRILGATLRVSRSASISPIRRIVLPS